MFKAEKSSTDLRMMQNLLQQHEEKNIEPAYQKTWQNWLN